MSTQKDIERQWEAMIDDLQGKNAEEWAKGIDTKPMMIDGKPNPEWLLTPPAPKLKNEAFFRWFVWVVHALAVLLIGVLVLAGILCWSALLGCGSPTQDIKDNGRLVEQAATEVKADAELIRSEVAAATNELASLQVDDVPTGGLSVVSGAMTRLGTIDATAGRITEAAGRVGGAAKKIQENAENVHDDRPLWRTLLALSPWVIAAGVVVALLFYSGTLPLAFQLMRLVLGVVRGKLGKLKSAIAAWHPWDAAESIKLKIGGGGGTKAET